MNRPRYLTKSRFKMATECPTKLFYTGKKEYGNTSLSDPFLAALADGGHQVGELAKQYYPGGVDITTLDYIEAEQQTTALLAQENVVIFEAAIRYQNLFIRVDVLVKKGSQIELIEVKAKSYSEQHHGDFLNTHGNIDSKWKPYIIDVAFQKYVMRKALPHTNISSYLMLIDKEQECASDGLNQKFVLEKDANNRKGVRVSNTLSEEDLKGQLLKKVNVDSVVSLTYERELTFGMPAQTFEENIVALAKYYEQDEKIAPSIGVKCKKCEFTCSKKEDENGLINARKVCWSEQLHWDESDFDDGTVLDIWNFRGADKCIEENIIKLTDVNEEIIGVTETKTAALSTKDRQWLQVQKSKDKDESVYFDTDSMRNEIANWRYPLHFIDFETSAVAIPFYKGMKPYEGIAFQFSHHVVHQDDRIEHADEFLHTEQGIFPNFEFIRALKAALEKDDGSIFMYSSHENTYLNTIRRQLKDSDESDKDILCTFIETIARPTGNSSDIWTCERGMIDMLDLVKKYYYDPATKGSNSIKYVLPAMLNSSEHLQKKYSKPIYGSATQGGIKSSNFVDKAWIEFDENGKVRDPYALLPKMFEDISEHDVDILSEGDELNNGGMALTAYAKLQFTHMSEYERKQLRAALLSYCELDTWAMVAIYEGWQEQCQ